jgi:conjugative relaxase-like TrwC/TraI family protein
MISKAAIRSGSHAAQYFYENGARISRDGRAEYYQNGDVTTAWLGRGAQLAGYAEGSAVTKELLVKTLDGHVRDRQPDGELGAWRQMNGRLGPDGKLVRRAGLDFTLSPPKSVSIEIEVQTREAVNRALVAGRDAAIQYLETHAAFARVTEKGVTQSVHTGNLVVMGMRHSLSREGDPDAHWHLLIANQTYHNGKVYALDERALLVHRHAADMVANNTMMFELRKAGIEVVPDGKGSFEIAGYTREDIEPMSKRRMQIKEELAAKGVDLVGASWASRQAACGETRQAKDAPDNAADHRQAWRAEIEAGRGFVALEAAKRPTAQQSMEAAREAVGLAVHHLSAREAAFSDKALMMAVMTFSAGRASQADLDKALVELHQKGQLLVREDGRLTTATAVEAERTMMARSLASQGTHSAIMSTEEFRIALDRFESQKTKEIAESLGRKIAEAREAGNDKRLGQLELDRANFERKGFHLTDKQVEVAHLVLCGKDGINAVKGLPGTGKTTVMAFLNAATTSKGGHLVGISSGAEQAAKLEADSGIKSWTAERWIRQVESEVTDARLAAAALKTYQDKGQVPWATIRSYLEVARNGGGRELTLTGRKAWTREFDSAGRTYLHDGQGNTYCTSLYREIRETSSANLNHLGLTRSKYALAKDGTVFKQGGTLYTEFVGWLRDKYNHLTRHDHSGRAQALGEVLFGKAEGWRPASLGEALVVKADLAIRNKTERIAEVAALKAQAQPGKNGPALVIMDEAGLSDQKLMNRFLAACEAKNAKGLAIGDPDQRSSVAAGVALEKLIDTLGEKSTVTLGLESVRRQKEGTVAYEVAQLSLRGRHGEAIERAQALGVVKELAGHQEAVKAAHPEAAPGDLRGPLRDAAQKDNQVVIARLAKDFVAKPKDEQKATLVITASNIDRAAINGAIREQLKQAGGLQEGRTFPVLAKTDRTEAQMTRAEQYREGDVVRFGGKDKDLEVAAGATATISRVDTRTNTVHATLESGRAVALPLEKYHDRIQVYRQEEREFAKGDRVRCTQNLFDRKEGKDLYRNGETGTVTGVTRNGLTLKLDSGEVKKIDFREYRFVDHAYCATGHAAQGQSPESAIWHHNAAAGRHGDQETNVNNTRATTNFAIYTNNVAKMVEDAGKALGKTAATDARIQEGRTVFDKSSRNVTAAKAVEGYRSEDHAFYKERAMKEQSARAAYDAAHTPARLIVRELVSILKGEEVSPMKTDTGFRMPQATDTQLTKELLEAMRGKAPEAAKATEPGKAPEAAKAAEPGKAPEAAKATEPGKVPEAVKATEPGKVPEAAKTVVATKDMAPAKTPEPSKPTSKETTASSGAAATSKPAAERPAAGRDLGRGR